MREDEVISLLSRAFAGPHAQLRLGIGDDAAVLAPQEGELVLSVDAAVQGVHFRLEYASLEAIGARSLHAAVSDLAAMGAEPRAALISLALPDGDEECIAALARGLRRAADATGCPIVGGNLSRASELSLHSTVVGVLVAPALTRSGARVGDGVWVSGTLGTAALGFQLLERGMGVEHVVSEAAAPFVARWRSGCARLDVGRAIRGLATACLDVSDGLVRDAERLAAASGVQLEIDAALLPLHTGHLELARLNGLDGLMLALTGGEDYELLFTAPSTARLEDWGTRIGTVRAGQGVVVLREGRALITERSGHDHFE